MPGSCDERGKRRAAPRVVAVVAMLLMLQFGGVPARGQASRPAEADPEKEMLLPTRRGSTGSQSPPGTLPSRSGDSWDFTRVGLSLAAVLLLVFGVQKAWKRLGTPGSASRASGLLQVVARLNVSPRQQVVLLRVGRRCVLAAMNGTQMNALCEISDPEEVSSLLGQEVAARGDSSSTSFNSVLGAAQEEYDEPASPVPPAPGATHPAPAAAEADPELRATKGELTDLMERVRSLSRQFAKK